MWCFILEGNLLINAFIYLSILFQEVEVDEAGVGVVVEVEVDSVVVEEEVASVVDPEEVADMAAMEVWHFELKTCCFFQGCQRF